MSFFGPKSLGGGRVAFNENFTGGGDPLSPPPPPINSCMVIALKSAWTVHDKIAMVVLICLNIVSTVSTRTDETMRLSKSYFWMPGGRKLIIFFPP
jgi:hypothetical protein